MKRLVLIFLILSYAFTSTQAYQLLKLPAFFEHYISHQKNSKMNFINYIKVHYFQKIQIDDDFAKDQKLPFKTVENNASFTCIAIAEFQKFNYKPIEFFIIKKYNVKHQNLFSTLLDKGLFRPPRA